MYHIHSGTNPSYTASVVTPSYFVSNCIGARSSTRGNFTALFITSLAIVLSWSQDLKNGTVFQLRFVSAHLNQNLLSMYCMHLFSVYYYKQCIACQTLVQDLCCKSALLMFSYILKSIINRYFYY